MQFKILLRGNYSPDAVSYYLELIERGIKHAFQVNPQVIYAISEVCSGDTVFVLDAKSHFLVWLKHPENKIISWFQGILPEENKMANPDSSFINKLRIKWWEWLENFSLKKAACNVFVSERMRLHYSTKYNYKTDNYLVIPCYNQQLNLDSLANAERYIQPTFVYAGSLADWQCIAETLELYKMIKGQLKKASLTIFTKEIEKATDLVNRFDLQDVNIEYVSYDKINERLQVFKYGFLLRKDHIVNQVATPTKMNTYLGNGVIPVYSNVMDAFVKNINTNFSIVLDNDQAKDALKVIDFDRMPIDSAGIAEEFLAVFKNYYNDDLYIGKITETKFFLFG